MNSSRVVSSLKTRSCLLVTSCVLCNTSNCKSVWSTMHRDGNRSRKQKLPLPPERGALAPKLPSWKSERASLHDSLQNHSFSISFTTAATFPVLSPLCCYTSHTRLWAATGGCQGTSRTCECGQNGALRMFLVTPSTIVSQSQIRNTLQVSQPRREVAYVAPTDVLVNALALRHHRQPHPAAAPHPGPSALRCMGLDAWPWTTQPVAK